MTEKIAEEVRGCKKCGLWETRTNAVPGEGNPNARIMFVGEAPGRNEDLRGKPFIGAAGKVFDRMLAAAGLERSEVFVTNILKCRPPGNRDPLPEEIKACTPYLDRQIKAIKPEVVCTLGNFATAYAMEKFGMRPQRIGLVHGQAFRVDTLEHHFTIVPMYHPATVTYNPGMESVLVGDCEVLSRTKPKTV
ncbi:MAG: uracil-DNA glycosylase [Candidatus Diapherotrites archaeon]|nr:uracil-DNA glycosylase [Candidatus Diapherotrites archaeon]